MAAFPNVAGQPKYRRVMPGLHHSVAVSPFPLAVAVAYLFAVYGCNGTEFSYVINFYRTTEFYNGRTAKRQRKNGKGMVETWH